MDLHAIRLEIPSDGNVIVGQSHFIKTVEDIYEAIVNTVPQMKFGIAFNEASGACLTRVDGNDDELKAIAAEERERSRRGAFVRGRAAGRLSDQREESDTRDAGSLHDFLCDGESGGSDRCADGAGQGSAGRDRWVVAEGRGNARPMRSGGTGFCGKSDIRNEVVGGSRAVGCAGSGPEPIRTV